MLSSHFRLIFIQSKRYVQRAGTHEGELVGYTELLEDARKEATGRMIEEARNIGANAVINVRFSTTSVTQGAAELFVYGTAVYVESE